MKLKMIAAAVLATAAVSANAGGLTGGFTSATAANGVVTPAPVVVHPAIAGGFLNPAAKPATPMGGFASGTMVNGVYTPAPKVVVPAAGGFLSK